MLRSVIRLLPAVLALGLLGAPAAHAAHPTARTLDHTRVRVVRPVRATGRAVPGFAVHRERGSVDCGSQSPYSVSGHVDTCFPSAAYLPSCWKAIDHTVLCLRNAEEKALVRFRFSGRFPAQAALPRSRRFPQDLRLADGERCWARVGGAWGDAPGHPHWVGFYSCTFGSLYGTPRSGGVNRTHAVWTVHELLADNSLVTRRVRSATYVGTAG